MRPSARWFTICALSLVLLLGGACVTRPQQATGPTAPAADTPPVLGADERPGPLYGIVWQNETSTSYLTRLEPRTLRPVADAPRLRVDGLNPWPMSPDRSLAPLGYNDSAGPDPNDSTGSDAKRSSVYLMDLEHMRQLAVIKATAAVGVPQGGLWLGADRVLLLGDRQDYQSVEHNGVTGLVSRTALVTTIVDVPKRRVISQQQRYVTGGELVAVEPSRDGLVVLLQPADRIGTAELGLVNTRGELHTVRLDRVTAGFQRAPGGGDAGSRQNRAGLAVDAGRERAYVVAAGSPVAEVDLARLDVAYHSLTTAGRAPSVLGMLRQVLAPRAEAKLQSGPERYAQWLGDGRLAVWGMDRTYTGDDTSPSGGSKPSGLQIVDTRDWSVRTLDPGAGRLVRAGDRLVTTGTTEHMKDGGDQATKGNGLRIRVQGTRRPVQLYAGRPFTWMQAFGRYVYVDLTDPNRTSPGPSGYAVIDTHTGTVLGEHKGSQMPDLMR